MPRGGRPKVRRYSLEFKLKALTPVMFEELYVTEVGSCYCIRQHSRRHHGRCSPRWPYGILAAGMHRSGSDDVHPSVRCRIETISGSGPCSILTRTTSEPTKPGSLAISWISLTP